MRLPSALLLVAALVAAPVAVAAPAHTAPLEARPVPADNPLVTSGPALVGPDLLGSLQCRGDVAGSPLTPVLLLHGTGSTPEESFGPVYLPQLEARGRPACTVQLPERATTDMQVSTEVVVAAIRAIAEARGGRIHVVGHSQGATLAVTAIKYWPDLPGLVEDYVGLAPTFNVGTTGELVCARPCSAPFQQRRAGSRYFAGVRSHPLPAGPSYTTIATRFDEIATPAPEASRLEGARNVVLQDHCPGKPVEHFGLITDGTVFAFVLDGLENPGTVEPDRVPTATCLDLLPPGSDPVTVAPLVAEAIANDLRANGESEKLSEEPTVRCYVLADCADVDDRGRLVLDARLAGGRLRLQVQAPGTLELTALGADGTTAATATAPLSVGAVDVPLPELPPGDYRLQLATTTAFYRVPGVEAVVPLGVPASAAGGRSADTGTAASSRRLASTGAAPLAAVAGSALVAAAALMRRRRGRA